MRAQWIFLQDVSEEETKMVCEIRTSSLKKKKKKKKEKEETTKVG